ncbi:hypothetical protein L6452_22926 [Arctium lappa]|uniref:Uncharacterized protein n=1 Tax=Arctium lappa TaxID=4217 RepID=A0ACB9B091_ARCLA|nr:hypothetical protein L6452_22926 [Arctium lappa]
MFKKHLGNTIEVYIDNMLVKSKQAIDHIDHLKQSFDILREYRMKLNLMKYFFRPEDHEVFQLYLAVSTEAVSVVLIREDEKQQLPIYYISKSLIDAVNQVDWKWNIYLSSYDIYYKPRTSIKSQTLADIVVDFSPEFDLQTEPVAILNDATWTLHVDVSSNALVPGLGVVLKSPQGDKMMYSIW